MKTPRGIYAPAGFKERLENCIRHSDESISKQAKLLGISRQRLYDYMNGVTTPDVTTLTKMCIMYNVAADYLIFGKPEQKKRNK